MGMNASAGMSGFFLVFRQFGHPRYGRVPFGLRLPRLSDLSASWHVVQCIPKRVFPSEPAPDIG
jgi:hypothetical protein